MYVYHIHTHTHARTHTHIPHWFWGQLCQIMFYPDTKKYNVDINTIGIIPF